MCHRVLCEVLKGLRRHCPAVPSLARLNCQGLGACGTLIVLHELVRDFDAPKHQRDAVHPTAAQVQQAAADEQATDGSHWRDETPTDSQLAAVSCKLDDAEAHSMVVVPGERPTVWLLSQQTGRTQPAVGAQFRYAWAICHASSMVWCGAADPKELPGLHDCWSRASVDADKG